MSDPLIQDPLEKTALALYYHAAQLLKSGHSESEITADLVSKGVRQETALMMLARLRQSRQNVARKQGQRHMLMGAVNLILGLLLLTGGFGAPAAGLVAILAWTAMGLGFAFFARGMMLIIG